MIEIVNGDPIENSTRLGDLEHGEFFVFQNLGHGSGLYRRAKTHGADYSAIEDGTMSTRSFGLKEFVIRRDVRIEHRAVGGFWKGEAS